MEKLSFVIPCYGSELVINDVLDEIHEVIIQKPEYDYEIICVNDCSPDNVLDVLIERAENDNRIVVADLTKNVGKASAVLAGYSIVSGDYVINIDDDGQCPLDELWNLFAPILEGKDAVFAAYTKKKQSVIKNIGSQLDSLMACLLIGKPKGLKTSNFSVVRRYVVDKIKQYKHTYPYLSGLIFKTTSNVANVTMEERERPIGRGNFTIRKSLSLWMNGFTAFSVIPLRISSIIGSLTAIVGFIYGASIIVRRLFIDPNMAIGYPSLMSAILFVGGMIMLMLGMLGEYVGRIYINQSSLPQYTIRKTVRGIGTK